MPKDETQNEETSSNSIIADKYRDGYKGAEDWLSEFIDGQVKKPVMKTKTIKDDDGNETTEEYATKQTRVDLEALFTLADQNSLDARARYADQVDRKNAAGRLRMTIGNMLRAAARHRHGLFDVEGEWNDAPEGFLGDHPKTQERDGTKIVPPKPEADAETETESEDAA